MRDVDVFTQLLALERPWSVDEKSIAKRQRYVIVGCTPKCDANSLTVRSPFTAARATWALNADV